MDETEPVALCATDAAILMERELRQAGAAAAAGDVEGVLDGDVRALGLALQLGPGAAGQALRAILDGAAALGRQPQGEEALAALGPALVDVVERVRESEGWPGRLSAAAMEAWASVAEDVAATIGQVGLALSLPAERRTGLLDGARRRAGLLDEATGGGFGLKAWLEEAERWNV